MIEETAVVTRVDDGQTWIRSLQSSACGGCAQHAACGAPTLEKLLPKREFSVDCDMTLQVGEHVRVAIDDSHLLLSSLLLYMLPLLVMLCCVGLASVLLPADIAEAWMPEIALLTLLSVFWLIHRFQGLFLLHFCFKPQIVGRINSC